MSSVTVKKGHFVLTAMMRVGSKTVGVILGLANRLFTLR
jgi:hypothetical protein